MVEKAKKILKTADESKLFVPLLFFVALIIIFLRSSYTFSSEVLYTEDGAWLGDIYRFGFWHALWHCKETYLVFGNILLLWCANGLNWIFAGHDLTYIPIWVAIMQYLFYAFCATMPLFCFRRRISIVSRLFCYLMIILLPLGIPGVSDYEIFGKISNVGYLVYFFTFALLVYRLDNKQNMGPLKLLLVDIGIFLGPTTNPACYVLVALFFVIDIVLFFRKNTLGVKSGVILLFKQRWFIQWIILGVLLCVTCCYTIRFLGIKQKGTIINNPNWNFSNFVIFFVRMILYPFIFKLYTLLSPQIGVVLLVLAGLLLTIYFIGMKRTKHNGFHFYILTLFASIFFTIATLIRTPLLLDDLNSLDRYYYTQNIMWICVFSMLFETNVYFKSGTYLLREAFAFFLVTQYIWGATMLFRFNECPIAGRFRDGVASADQIYDGGYVVTLQPENFHMWITEEQMNATIYRRRE